MTDANPTITRLLRYITAGEVLVLLIAGGGLFFFPAAISPLWPWALTPFNTRFLVSIYLGAVVSAFMLVRVGRWLPARVILPTVLLFTGIVLVVSILYINQFQASSLSTWAWFALYIIIPVNALYHLWLYRKQTPANTVLLSATWRALFTIQAVALGAYGLGLLVLPATFSAFWPWPLDDFHARMYSVAFLTPALGGWLVRQAASPIEWFTLGLTQLVGSGLAIMGFVIVEADAHRADWGAAGTWLWIGIGAVVAIAGLGMILQTGRRSVNLVTESNT